MVENHHEAHKFNGLKFTLNIFKIEEKNSAENAIVYSGVNCNTQVSADIDNKESSGLYTQTGKD